MIPFLLACSSAPVTTPDLGYATLSAGPWACEEMIYDGRRCEREWNGHTASLQLGTSTDRTIDATFPTWNRTTKKLIQRTTLYHTVRESRLYSVYIVFDPPAASVQQHELWAHQLFEMVQFRELKDPTQLTFITGKEVQVAE